jgi:anti-anti-sigma factor
MNAPFEHLTTRSFMDGDRRVVALAGELDLANGPRAEQALEEQFDVLDLSQLQFMDSVGVRVLLRLCNARPDPVTVRGVTRSVRRILELTGVSNLVEFEEDGTDRIGSQPTG